MSMSTCRHPGFYNPNKSKYCLYSLIEAVVELQSVSPSRDQSSFHVEQHATGLSKMLALANIN